MSRIFRFRAAILRRWAQREAAGGSARGSAISAPQSPGESRRYCPAAAEFGPNHQQSLASAGHKFGVAAPFPDRRGRNKSAIHLTGLVRAIMGWLLIKNILKVITTVTPKVRAIYLWKSRHGRVTAGSQ